MWRLTRGGQAIILARPFHSISDNMQLRRKRVMSLLTGFFILNSIMMATRLMNSGNIETTLRIQNIHSGLKMNLLNSRSERGLENSAGIRASTVTSVEDKYKACREKFDWGVLKRSNKSSSFTILPHADPCCLGRPGSIFLLIVVTSSPRQFKIRQVIRETWGSVEAAGGGSLRVLIRFLLGTVRGASHAERTQSVILAENARHGDIIQGEFEDVYRNLTLKTIAGMEWAGRYCPAASYVMKTDSDVYVNVEGLVQYLSNSSQNHHRRLAIGDVAIGAKPIRSTILKWYTSEAEYSLSAYPPFMKGPGYVVSAETVQMLIQNFSKTPLFVWEDVYIGMCLNNLGLVPTADERFETWGVSVKTGCDVARRFMVHGVKYYKLKSLWRIHQTVMSSRNCLAEKT